MLPDDEIQTAVAGVQTAILWLIGVVVVAAVAIYAGVALRQAAYATRPYDPAVLSGEARRAADEWTALEAMRGEIADRESQLIAFAQTYGADPATWPQGKRAEYQQLQTHAANARSAYRTACAAYAARWIDEWRTVVAPQTLPRQCPAP